MKITLFLTFFVLIVQTAITSDTRLLYEKTLQTEPNKELIVTLFAGNIIVNTWTNNEVNVKFYGNDEAQDKLIFNADNTETGVKVEAMRKGTGNIKKYTSGGNVVVDNNKGNLNISTAGGNITANSFNGSVNVSTMGGHVTLNGSNGKVEASTAGGNISVDYSGKNLGMNLSTMGGNITATLPGDFDANAELGTLAGRITCDFADVNNKNKISCHVKTKFNSGGETFNCTTSAGNIVVVKK